MIVAIHQPQFLPWLGYFDKMDQADFFCLLDTVQYKKNEWQNRNRIKVREGWQWLTVPVTYRFPQKIHEVGINQGVNWGRKHLQALRTYYSKAPFFDRYFPEFETLYGEPAEMLLEINVRTIFYLRDALGITTPIVRSSEMELSEEPTERLIDICSSVGANTYLAGRDGRKYMDLKKFSMAGLTIRFQDYEHPEYRQINGPFVSHLSVVDLLFNHGEKSLEIIRSTGRERSSPATMAATG